MEIESLAQFDARAATATSMSSWRVQSVDLRERGAVLRRLDAQGAVFLGCTLTQEVENDLRARGALLFPVLPALPFDPYRSRLYSPGELYHGLGAGYADTPDAQVYGWSRQARPDLAANLAQSLHDLSIDDALEEWTRGRHLVGVMGGHALRRDSDGYRDAARLGRALARAGLTVATGGGPGAMEAANLGAYLAGHDADVLEQALDLLAAVPGFPPSVTAWARAAFDVRRRWPGGGDSLGIPTWFYGHEPPNVFASVVAKYFKNAIREDILLHLCRAGIVFLPGAAGTVQEVFQDACENYYADDTLVAPMVLVGTRHWTEELPAWPLLEALAGGREMAEGVHLVDDLASVLPLLHPPGG